VLTELPVRATCKLEPRKLAGPAEAVIDPNGNMTEPATSNANIVLRILISTIEPQEFVAQVYDQGDYKVCLRRNALAHDMPKRLWEAFTKTFPIFYSFDMSVQCSAALVFTCLLN
jgi:hypothetical protein